MSNNLSTDIFPTDSFDSLVHSEKTYKTGKLICLSSNALFEVAENLLKFLKKSLKHGFENLKTFPISFFNSAKCSSFLNFLARKTFSIRNDGVFDDLEDMLQRMHFDAIKYENFRKWKRMEKQYQMIFVIGDGVIVTDDSREAFVNILHNQVFVLNQDHVGEDFLLKEVKPNERNKDFYWNNNGGYSSFLMCFYFV